jgi:rod shape-determining protein MreC
MRDSRRARLVLAMLLLTAFTLITLDYRTGGGGPLRAIGNAVFGPVERAVSAVTSPVGSFFSSLGNLNGYKADNKRLTDENESLKERLRLTDSERTQLASAEKLLDLAGRAQFRIVAAHVVAIGGNLGFEWTATIDAGRDDGLRRNQTVINGSGLVGKTIYVGPSTSTILLGCDPTFTAGARLATSHETGYVDGGGEDPMELTLLDPAADVAVDDRLVTFASSDDRPFVPEVPIGFVTEVTRTPGELSTRALVAPYVDFTALDLVGVVVERTRTIPRDSLLPASPSPAPSPSTPTSETTSPPPDATTGRGGTASPGTTGTP